MAFSYSDKNFTVVGNLCFVHILLDGTKKSFDIPQAIGDRILFDGIKCVYPYFPTNAVSGSNGMTLNVGFATIISSKIFCSDKGEGYLNFCFPIDSNK